MGEEVSAGLGARRWPPRPALRMPRRHVPFVIELSQELLSPLVPLFSPQTEPASQVAVP